MEEKCKKTLQSVLKYDIKKENILKERDGNMKKNLVLIGMSGAGKSTVGIALSYKLRMSFVDVDSYIERTQNMTVSEFFNTYGAERFREIETEAVKHMGNDYQNTIISTGGGVILNPENMEYLKKNGIVVYINRSVENILKTLNTEKRPLLKDNPERLREMYKDRHELYLKYADVVVVNGADFKSGVDNVYDAVKEFFVSN